MTTTIITENNKEVTLHRLLRVYYEGFGSEYFLSFTDYEHCNDPEEKIQVSMIGVTGGSCGQSYYPSIEAAIDDYLASPDYYILGELPVE